MRNLFSIIIVISFIYGCETQKNPLGNESELSQWLADISWQSLKFPLSEAGSNPIFELVVNSEKDVFACDNRAQIFRLLQGESTWTFQVRKWDKTSSFIQVDSKNNILFGYSHNSTFYGSGIIISEDRGETWSDFYETNDECKSMTSLNDTIYVAGGHSVVMSADYGQSWIHIDDSLSGYKSIEGIAVDPVSHNIFVGTWRSGVLRSTDSGSSWQLNGFNDWSVFPLFSLFNGYIYAGTGIGLYRTIDHGNSWNKLPNGMPDTDILCITSNSNNDLLVGTAKDGVFLSMNYGDEWYNIGLEGIRIHSIAVDNEDYVYIGTDSIGVMKSTVTINFEE